MCALYFRTPGRILSVAWYDPENVIVTGGIDNIRIWSVKSGHAIQRLTMGRQLHNKETIVWAVAVTRYLHCSQLAQFILTYSLIKDVILLFL